MSADAAPAVSSAPVEHGGFVLEGSTPSQAVKDSLKAFAPKDAPASDDDGDPIAKAAAELGKKGGKATAAKRAKEAKAEPEPKDKAAPAATKAAPDEAAPDDDEDGADGEERRSRSKQRIEELARERAEERRSRERAEERAARAERERDEFRARAERAAQPADREPAREQRPTADSDEAPQLEKFLAETDDYNKGLDAYLEARDKHRDAQREKEHRAAQRAEGIGARVRTFAEKVKAEGPDFMAGLSPDVQGLKPSFALDHEKGERATGRTFVADALVLYPEHATGIMRHLSDDEGEFRRITALSSPYRVSFEIGRIVARLEGATAGNSPSDERPASKPASKAPPPAKPVVGAPSAASGTRDYGPREGEAFDAWLSRTAR